MKDYKVNKEKMSDAFCREVYGVVRDVPAGKVISYGEIASLLGKPQCSRMVGRALKQVPSELNLPCHRVVNAQGRLAPDGKNSVCCCRRRAFVLEKMEMWI